MSISTHEQVPAKTPGVLAMGENGVRLDSLEEGVPAITINPERMGGTPVIGIERLPVEYLIGYLAKGGTVDEFVDEFSADREKVLAVLQLIREALADGWLAERIDY